MANVRHVWIGCCRFDTTTTTHNMSQPQFPSPRQSHVHMECGRVLDLHYNGPVHHTALHIIDDIETGAHTPPANGDHYRTTDVGFWTHDAGMPAMSLVIAFREGSNDPTTMAQAIDAASQYAWHSNYAIERVQMMSNERVLRVDMTKIV